MIWTILISVKCQWSIYAVSVCFKTGGDLNHRNYDIRSTTWLVVIDAFSVEFQKWVKMMKMKSAKKSDDNRDFIYKNIPAFVLKFQDVLSLQHSSKSTFWWNSETFMVFKMVSESIQTFDRPLYLPCFCIPKGMVYFVSSSRSLSWIIFSCRILTETLWQ